MRGKIVLIGLIFLVLILGVPMIERSSADVNDMSLFTDSSFDLIVYGGDPEGVVAALAGARNGLKTLLVMEEAGPGGLMVYGALNFLDLNYDSKGRVINKGIFREWHKLVGGGVMVDLVEAQKAFVQLLLAEENLTIVPTTCLNEVKLNENQNEITSLVFETTGISKTHDMGTTTTELKDINSIWQALNYHATIKQLNSGAIWEVAAKTYIDASQDADLAAMAGAPYFLGGADVGLPDRKMAVTLVFQLKNVDWQALRKDINSQKWGYSRMNSSSAWGLGKIGTEYLPIDPATKLRGLNIGRQEDGTVFINALQIFDLDVLDPTSLVKGMEQGKKEAHYVVEYLRKNLSGFENIELMDFPTQLYVRESRHILALYQLDILDLIENVDFPDKIALSSYPVDYQATSPVDPGFVIFNPGMYSIPFRSLVPRDLLNLLVVGRSTGFGSLAAGSARVIPTGMATAEAAGVAAALSIEEAENFHNMATDHVLITALQQQLISQGVDLRKIEGKNKIVTDPDYEVFKELFSWGMIVAGYDNKLNLDKGIKEREFAFLLMKGMMLREAANYTEYLAGGLYSLSDYIPLKRDKACELLLAAGGYWLEKVDDVYKTAKQDDFIPQSLMASFEMNRLLTRRDVYHLINYFLKRYPIPKELQSLRTRGFGE